MNEAGIKYYSDLIDALLAEGITPCVTIFHWDYPLALEEKYGGFIDERIVDDFVAYAQILFERLGDRVKHWITINEVSALASSLWPSRLKMSLMPTASHLYILAEHGVESGQVGLREGHAKVSLLCHRHKHTGIATDLGRLAKTLLLCNARTVDLYRKQYKAQQQGTIGITLVSLYPPRPKKHPADPTECRLGRAHR